MAFRKRLLLSFGAVHCRLWSGVEMLGDGAGSMQLHANSPRGGTCFELKLHMALSTERMSDPHWFQEQIEKGAFGP